MKFREDLLHTSRQNPMILKTLKTLMEITELDSFILVGGTNLALRFDHRYSVDIDLFTGAEYGSIDFKRIKSVLIEHFTYCLPPSIGPTARGETYFIGESESNCIKLDLMYTEPFFEDFDLYGSLRFASVKDIVAMKMDAVSTGARKKDFWDIHFLLEMFSLEEMITLHEKRYPYTHEREQLLEKLTDFESVEKDPEPICFMGKDWGDIKLDIISQVETIIECTGLSEAEVLNLKK